MRGWRRHPRMSQVRLDLFLLFPEQFQLSLRDCLPA